MCCRVKCIRNNAKYGIFPLNVISLAGLTLGGRIQIENFQCKNFPSKICRPFIIPESKKTCKPRVWDAKSFFIAELFISPDRFLPRKKEQPLSFLFEKLTFRPIVENMLRYIASRVARAEQELLGFTAD